MAGKIISHVSVAVLAAALAILAAANRGGTDPPIDPDLTPTAAASRAAAADFLIAVSRSANDAAAAVEQRQVTPAELSDMLTSGFGAAVGDHLARGFADALRDTITDDGLLMRKAAIEQLREYAAGVESLAPVSERE